MAHVTTRDGVRLHYRERGRGRPLVMIPGWGASTRWFDAQLESLSSRLRVVAIDPRFHGLSDRPAHGGRVSRAAMDVRELLDALDLDDVVLLGWSIGVAHVLSYFDLFGSERIGRFVLVCGSSKPLNDESWSNGFTDIAGAIGFKALAAADPVTLARSNVPTYFRAPRPAYELEWMIADTAGLPPAAAAVAFDCIVQDYRDTLSRLDRPTLAVYARHDPVVPVTNVEFVAGALPGALTAVFEDSGHCPFIEEPDRFNALVGGFATEAPAERLAGTASA